MTWNPTFGHKILNHHKASLVINLFFLTWSNSKPPFLIKPQRLLAKAVNKPNKSLVLFPTVLWREFLLLSQSPSIRMDESPLKLKRSLMSIKTKSLARTYVVRKQLVTLTHQLQSNISKCSLRLCFIYILDTLHFTQSPKASLVNGRRVTVVTL